MRALFLAAVLLPTQAYAEQAPAIFDVRVPAALRNDLAGTLIKLQQAGLCDVACHLVIARALVALDTALPVTEPPPAEKP